MLQPVVRNWGLHSAPAPRRPCPGIKPGAHGAPVSERPRPSPQPAGRRDSKCSIRAIGKSHRVRLETPTAQTVAPVKVTRTDPPCRRPLPRRRIPSSTTPGLCSGSQSDWPGHLSGSFDNTVKSLSELDRLQNALLWVPLFDANAKNQVPSAGPTRAVHPGLPDNSHQYATVNVDDPVKALSSHRQLR